MSVIKSQKPKAKRNQQNNIIYGIVAAAVVVAILFIGLNFVGTGSSVAIDYENIPVTRAEDGAFVLGNPDAPFTLVAFEDYMCGFCQSYEPTLKQFIKEYVETGQARFEYRNLQTASRTDTLFRVAQCAGNQQPERFFEFREELFTTVSRGGWNDATSPRQFAERMGLNYTEILDCTPGMTQVATDAALASTVGATGTPFLFYRDATGTINPLPIGQAPNYSALKAFIDGQI